MSDESTGYVQLPEETFNKKIVDCGDLAYFISKILEKHGYETFILSIGWNHLNGEFADAHAVAVYKDEKGYHYIQPFPPFEMKISEGYIDDKLMAEGLFESMEGSENHILDPSYTYFEEPDDFRENYMNAVN